MLAKTTRLRPNSAKCAWVCSKAVLGLDVYGLNGRNWDCAEKFVVENHVSLVCVCVCWNLSCKKKCKISVQS